MDRAQHIMESAALVLGSILVAALICFALVDFDSDLFNLGITFEVVKTVE